jgi:hypothetical protein
MNRVMINVNKTLVAELAKNTQHGDLGISMMTTLTCFVTEEVMRLQAGFKLLWVQSR